MTGVKARANKLWILVKDPDGKWIWQNTPLRVGQEKEAAKLRQQVLERIAAGAEVMGEFSGPVTVAAWAKRWIAERPKLGVKDWKKDEERLRLHILPLLGPMALADVRPKHLVALVKSWRTDDMAPRTVRNCYCVLRGLFRDAALDGLIDQTPCILTRHQIGTIRDKNPEWRATAIYSRDEVELLVSHPDIPLDRRVVYAILGLAGARHEEMATLRWRQYDPKVEPLGRLNIIDGKKGGIVRPTPVHPVLAALLAEWRLEGWPALWERAPQPDDLIVPRAPENAAQPRDRAYTRHRSLKDLATAGMRHRRMHDLRRTFISLGVEAGHDDRVVKRITHKAPSDVMGMYTTLGWAKLCEVVLSIKVSRRGRKSVAVGQFGQSRAISRDLRGSRDP